MRPTRTSARPAHHKLLTALRALPVLALMVTASAAEFTVSSGAHHQENWSLVVERMEWMPAVAHWKIANGVAIEDLEREAVVLKAAVAQAEHVGLAAPPVRAFMQLQMDLAKKVQQKTVAGGDRPANPPDLIGVIRPALNRISSRWLLNTARHGSPGTAPDSARRALRSVGLSDQDVDSLGAALAQVRHGEPNSMVARIQARGVLRVGTTGDYAPFSVRTESASGTSDWRGIDIDLAQSLADSLEVDLLLIPTSWPQIMNDLRAGRFDIAMSGVSRTLARAREALFSQPYHVGGKTPIARCAEREQFAELQDIDRPGVRLIVNPGGTNQRFVSQHIQQAAVSVHADNRTVFAEIQKGAADVMITDAIEVRLQSHLTADSNSPLCGTRITPFNHQSKGFLLQPDPHWQAYVDLWLEQVRAAGKLARAFARHAGAD